MCPRINWISKILAVFCCFRLYLGIETISCRLLQRMARMDMDWNLKKLGQLFQVLTPCLQKSPENSMIGQLSRDVIGRLSVKPWCYWLWRLVMSLVRFDPSIRDFQIQWRDGNENVAWKVNLRSFSLYRNYSYPITLSNRGEPSQNWIARDHNPSSEREIKFRLCLFMFSIKREIRHFHVVVVQKREQKCIKKRDARAKLLFCL